MGSVITPLSNFFAGLGLDRHVLVHDADAAFLRHRDGQPGFGHRVHRRRHHRQADADIACELTGKIDLARQHVRARRNEQDVVEGQCFFEDTHGAPRLIRRSEPL
jgi:hypothetical protein